LGEKTNIFVIFFLKKVQESCVKFFKDKNLCWT